MIWIIGMHVCIKFQMLKLSLNEHSVKNEYREERIYFCWIFIVLCPCKIEHIFWTIEICGAVLFLTKWKEEEKKIHKFQNLI